MIHTDAQGIIEAMELGLAFSTGWIVAETNPWGSVIFYRKENKTPMRFVFRKQDRTGHIEMCEWVNWNATPFNQYTFHYTEFKSNFIEWLEKEEIEKLWCLGSNNHQWKIT